LLDKLEPDDLLSVLLDDGEPRESVSQSVVAEGHDLVESVRQDDGHYRLLIRKNLS